MTNTLEISKYKSRHFVFEDVWEFGGMRLKAYLVTTSHEHSVPQELIVNAKAYIDLTLPEIRTQEGEDHGLGYVILHMGEMRNWLLIHWWAYENIAMGMLASAEIGVTQFKSEDHRRFNACVWEHVVINHERDAWIDKVMTGTGDVAAYLNDRLTDGYH